MWWLGRPRAGGCQLTSREASKEGVGKGGGIGNYSLLLVTFGYAS